MRPPKELIERPAENQRKVAGVCGASTIAHMASSVFTRPFLMAPARVA